MICEHHFDFVQLSTISTEENLAKKIITITQEDGRQVAIDTETREVAINHGEGCEKIKSRVE